MNTETVTAITAAASTVSLDASQLDQLLTCFASLYTLGVLIAALLALSIGVSLGALFFSRWR